ncbi:MAG TPA: hypothetical protein VLI43_03140 [Gemmatimonadaceae bacterium]|nr:hypothetical protein [Gemmatimonadaceae bacterium]
MTRGDTSPAAAFLNDKLMTNCATPAELLLVVIADPRSGAPDDWSDHIGSCSTCRARLDEVRARMASLAATYRVANAHLDDFSFAEVAGASRMRELADAAVAHLGHCEPCRREQAEIVRLLRDPLVRAELDRDRPLSLVPGDAHARVTVERTSRGSRPYLTRIAAAGLAAAAALVVSVSVVRSHGPGAETPAALRHATIDVAHASLPVAPLGVVRHVDAMVWTSVPHADLYRVSIFDERGQVVWETEVADTTAPAPAKLLEQSSGELRWRVKARTSFDQWIDSDFAEFSLKGDQ